MVFPCVFFYCITIIVYDPTVSTVSINLVGLPLLYYIVPKRFTTIATQPDMNDKNYKIFVIGCVVGCRGEII